MTAHLRLYIYDDYITLYAVGSYTEPALHPRSRAPFGRTPFVDHAAVSSPIYMIYSPPSVLSALCRLAFRRLLVSPRSTGLQGPQFDPPY